MKTAKTMILAAATLLGAQYALAMGPKLEVKTHTAEDSGFAANSHLIYGNKEAILVDAQFTLSEAAKTVEMIQSSGRKLKAVFITHGHPDHYLGLEVILKAFPMTQVLATPEVVEEIKATAQGKIDYWKPMYKDDLAETFVVPQPLKSKTLTLEGQKIQVVELGEGESEKSAALYLPSTRTLVAGDLAYNGVHLWLAENRPEAWLKNLDQVKQLGKIRKVLPGHGPNGNAKVLDLDAQYIRDYIEVTTSGLSKQQAITELTKRYPGFRLPIIAELSVGPRLK